MQTLAETAEREKNLLCGTYTRYPLHVVQGRGSRLFDAQGREYVDLLAGIAVCSLGHCHPEVTRAITEQAQELVHVSNLFYQTPQLDLAQRLLATCDLGRVFFCNSGAEANEAAIKLARSYSQKVREKQGHEIITLQGSFHGRTLATLTATGQAKIQQGFEPLPPGFVTVPFADIQALESAVTERTAGVMLEVIQGEGGVRNLPADYLHQVQAMCRERGILFIVDEVQTGMGRTGKMWAHQHLGLRPDVMTVAKGLANGLPIGAMLCSSQAAQGFGPGSHATTFGGSPLVSRVGCTVLDIIDRDRLCMRAQALGDDLGHMVAQVQDKHPGRIVQVRGQGLMAGIELTDSGHGVWQSLLDKGFICNLTQERVLRLLPALTIDRSDLELFVAALDDALSATKT